MLTERNHGGRSGRSGSDTLAGHHKHARPAGDWRLRTVSGLRDAEELLDCLEEQGSRSGNCSSWATRASRSAGAARGDRSKGCGRVHPGRLRPHGDRPVSAGRVLAQASSDLARSRQAVRQYSAAITPAACFFRLPSDSTTRSAAPPGNISREPSGHVTAISSIARAGPRPKCQAAEPAERNPSDELTTRTR